MRKGERERDGEGEEERERNTHGMQLFVKQRKRVMNTVNGKWQLHKKNNNIKVSEPCGGNLKKLRLTTLS